jgi:hypothetical protein
MQAAKRKWPGHRGDGRAANDQMSKPIAGENTQNGAARQAAEWYAANRSRAPRPLVPFLMTRFGLSAADAVRALAMAGRAT